MRIKQTGESLKVIRGLSVFLCLVWSTVLLMGTILYRSISQQNVHGYPNIDQLVAYVILPVLLASANLALAIRAPKIPTWFASASFILQLLTLPVLFVIGGGGV
jgi:hypothetical protein